jgi:hypothetical protein
MTDIQLRGLILQKLYQNRGNYQYELSEDDFSPPISDDEILRICAQLAQHGMVDAKIVDLLGGDRLMPYCRLSARGVDVVESGSSPDLKVEFMSTPTVNISGSSNFMIGNHNTQHIQQNFHELIQAIDKSDATPEQKAEAKGLLRKTLEHPLFNSLVGAGASALLGAL